MTRIPIATLDPITGKLAAEDLPDNVLIAITDRGAWAAGTQYHTHDLVTYGGTTWLVEIAHVSASAFDDTKFTELNSYRGAWQANTRYEAGDQVINGGSLYSANSTFTSGSSFNPTNWTQLTSAVGVSSFNTRTGAVALSKADVTGTGLAASDVGADASGAASSAQAASLQKSSNLSDVASASTARANLGLGTAATHAVTDFDTAGAAAAAQAASDPSGAASAAQAASLQKTSNLSDVAVAATARTNLGLGSAATHAATDFDASGAAAAAQAAAIAASAQGLTPTAVKTSAYSAAAGDFVPVDISGGSLTVTLPNAPADKTRIGIKVIKVDGSHANAATVARAGSDVFNVAAGSTSLTLSALFQGVLLQYKASTGIWYVSTADTPIGQANGAGSLDATGRQPIAQSPLSVAIVSSANVFTAAQTFDTSASPQVTALVAKAQSTNGSVTYASFTDSSSDVPGGKTVEIYNAGSASGKTAGGILFYGSGATSTAKAAWNIGVDQGASSPNRDFFIARENANGTDKDCLYFNYSDGTAAATCDFYGGNGGNAVTINSPTNAVGDPATLVLRPTSGQTLPAFQLQNGQGATRDQVRIYSDGRTAFRASLPANVVTADGVTNTDTSLVSASYGFSADDEGRYVTGTGIPAGTYIQSVTNATTVVLNQATTATATGVSFTVYRTSFRVIDSNVAPRFTIGLGTGSGAAILNVAATSIGPGAIANEASTLGIHQTGTSNATFKLGTASWGNFQITAAGTSPGDVTLGTTNGTALRIGSNGPTVALAVDTNQNVLVGPGAKATAAELATAATDAFFHIPTMNGTPSGTPAHLYTGAAPMVIDRTGNKLWFYIGGAWKGVAVA